MSNEERLREIIKMEMILVLQASKIQEKVTKITRKSRKINRGSGSKTGVSFQPEATDT